MNLLLSINKNLEISVGNAFLIALIAMAIIMALLVSIMLLIYLMAFVLKKGGIAKGKLDGKIADAMAKIKKNKKASKDAAEEESSEAALDLAPGSCGKVKLHDVPDRDAAMIMAIVADKLQKPMNELRFISIKEIKD